MATQVHEESDTSEMTLPAGEYYVGDLIHVLQNEEWVYLQDTKGVDGGVCRLENGHLCASYDIPFGSCYRDSTHIYECISGSLGCIRLQDITSNVSREEMYLLGRIVTMNRNFEPSFKSDVIGFAFRLWPICLCCAKMKVFMENRRKRKRMT